MQTFVTQRRVITPNVPAPNVETGAGEVFNAFAGFAEEMGARIDKQARENYALRMDSEMRGNIERIGREHQGEPDALYSTLADYHDKLMENTEFPDMRAALSRDFGLKAVPHLNRAYAAKAAVLDAETTTNTLLAIDEARNDMQNTARDLFSPDADVAAAAGLSVQRNMQRIQGMLSQTKGDGTPMFTAQQQAAKTLAARDAMFQTAASDYITAAPNKMRAYAEWRAGGVTVTMPGEDGEPVKFNIRELMPPEARVKADKEFLRAVKDEISIADMMERREERAFKNRSRDIEASITRGIQDGADMLQYVEGLRSQLEPETYTRLRGQAISEDPLTDADYAADLLRRARKGEDVTAEAEDARFNQKIIGNDVLQEALELSQRGRDAIGDPIKNGASYIDESLGGNSELLDLYAHRSKAQAKRDFREAAESFIEKEGRNPTSEEVRKMAEPIIDRYSALALDEAALALPKPRFMTAQQKNRAQKMTAQDIEAIREKTDRYYIEKLGTAEAALKDPDYLREMEYIDNFESIISKGAAQ